MDEIKITLRNMQDEMTQQKAHMLDIKEEIKNTDISGISEKINNLELKSEYLEEQINLQRNKIDYMDRIMRKKNVLFFGVEECERSYRDLEHKVLDIINNILNIKCNERGIDTVRRLGKRGGKTRPIIVTLVTQGLKIKILKNKKKMQISPYYLREDYPPEVLSKRKELQAELKTARDSGKRAFIKYDKLVILEFTDGQKDMPGCQQEQEINNSNKINRSESRQSLTSGSDDGNHQEQQQLAKLRDNSTVNNLPYRKTTVEILWSSFSANATPRLQLRGAVAGNAGPLGNSPGGSPPQGN